MTAQAEWLPASYSVPSSGDSYFKPAAGDNKVRIMGELIRGWEIWESDGDGNRKPHRSPEKWGDDLIDEMNTKEGEDQKHFWCTIVWDYASETFKVWGFTQASIQKTITNIVQNPDFGNPTGYDLNIKKTGEGMMTRYEIMASPPKELFESVKAAWKALTPDLEVYFDGGHPLG